VSGDGRSGDAGGDRAGDLPVVHPPFGDPGPERADAAVAGVLLAAGRSSRFGAANKLLADLDGEPLVRHAARRLRAARGEALSTVVAVVGHEADRVRAALSGPELRTVENPDPAAGQATSVQAGVEAIRAEADAAVFALGDMPRVRPGSVERLVAAYRAGDGDALAAAHRGARGNPVLFDGRHFDALADVAGDVGGREILLSGTGSALVETGDPGVLIDVDTPENLDALREE